MYPNLIVISTLTNILLFVDIYLSSELADLEAHLL